MALLEQTLDHVVIPETIREQGVAATSLRGQRVCWLSRWGIDEKQELYPACTPAGRRDESQEEESSVPCAQMGSGEDALVVKPIPKVARSV